jgi:hypothetical protein
VENTKPPPRVDQWSYFRVVATVNFVKHNGDLSDIRPELFSTVVGFMLYEMMGTKMLKTRNKVEVV